MAMTSLGATAQLETKSTPVVLLTSLHHHPRQPKSSRRTKIGRAQKNTNKLQDRVGLPVSPSRSEAQGRFKACLVLFMQGIENSTFQSLQESPVALLKQQDLGAPEWLSPLSG